MFGSLCFIFVLSMCILNKRNFYLKADSYNRRNLTENTDKII